MKILIVSAFEKQGGAAMASNRLFESFKNQDDMTTQLMVRSKKSISSQIIESHNIKNKVFNIIFYNITSKFYSKVLKMPSFSSGNWFPSVVLNKINESNVDIVNLHWINSEFISINQISKIKKPIVMTLHDMWAFCGGEHYSGPQDYYISGYPNLNDSDLRYKFNQSVWRRKYNNWKVPFYIVTPSSWLTDCAKKSALFKGWPIYTIPNVLNTDIFSPKKIVTSHIVEKNECFIIGFGAIGGTLDSRKGFDLLLKSLELMKKKYSRKIKCLIFGQDKPANFPDVGFETIFTGHISNESELSIIYNAMDLMVVPSRLEAFGQTASEAQSCGIPVVAFATTGLIDVVEHKKTGYLAKPFDCEDLMNGIEFFYNIHNTSRYRMIKESARKRAVSLWSEQIINQHYKKLFNMVLNERN
ncbi:glycosyltransferase [Moritella sp. F3]|uniref:glycosyltransferase n=1 Tax=Moritella sp. F3 TaxID=2718882 RepID=UPI0018E13AE9|nr:glycosyltransferase [Moritella sp. F3]GIC77266.1 glycosyl transferase [Moritella sp. F1]GIC83206.1 glycosyl transferase [Moritella sp. F3]